jgi:hypothetical protein
MQTFYTCYVDLTGGSNVEHASKAEAVKEAERLARMNVGNKVYLLECVAICQAKAVEWEGDVLDPNTDLPF